MLLYELLFASASLKSCCKGNFLDRLFVSESSLLLRNVLLLKLSRSDGLVELTLSNVVSFLDVFGICNELRHLNFDFRAVDVERLSLDWSSSSVVDFYLVVDVVELFVDEGLGKILLVDNLTNRVVLEDVHLLRAADATSEREDTTLSWI